MIGDHITIRWATPDDASAIAEVRDDAIRNIKHKNYDKLVLDEWAGPVEDRIKKLLSNFSDIRIVAEIDKKIVGYGELVTIENLLGACYVLSAVGGQGVGKAIVDEIERIGRGFGLSHLQMESSANAEPFYIRCGYQVVERSKHIMRSGSAMDCVMMRKDLSL